MKEHSVEEILIKAENEYSKNKKEYKKAMERRQEILNDAFKFTKANIAQLDCLNKILAKKQQIVLVQAEAFRKFIASNITNTDWEIEFTIDLFDNKTHFKNTDAEGDSFFSGEFRLPFNKVKGYEDEDKACFYNDNWNEFRHRSDHPLGKQFHCYTFHHLYDHTFLAWQDLVSIRDVWIDIKLQIQHNFKIPKIKTNGKL